MKPSRLIVVFCSLGLIVAAPAPLQAQKATEEEVNRHSLAIQEFQKRVGEYVKLHKEAEGQLPRLKPTDSPAAITHHSRALAERIRHARRQARQGDVFTPEIVEEFHHLIGVAMQGPKAARIRKSLKRAEPRRLHLRVNDQYPEAVPLQSSPPTLLLNLPALPPEVDYRVVDHDLILRDVKANLVVDFIRHAIPRHGES